MMNENFLEPPLAETRDFCALSFLFWLSDSVQQSGHEVDANRGVLGNGEDSRRLAPGQVRAILL